MCEFMNMHSHVYVPMCAYALVCICVFNCMCLSMLVVFYCKYICLYLHRQKLWTCNSMYLYRNLHMFMSICMSPDVYVCCIRYSRDHMPTDCAVDTHLNVNQSTVMHIEASNYAGVLCIVPDRNTHAISLI